MIDVREGDEIEAMPGQTESRDKRSRAILTLVSSFKPAFTTIMNIFRNRQYTLLALSFTCANQSRSDRQGLALVA